MKPDTLIYALGGIDDDLVRAADEEIPRQRHAMISWRRFTALAACIALLAGGLFGLMHLPDNRPHTPPILGEETSDPVTTTPPVGTTTPLPDIDTFGSWTDAHQAFVIVTIVDITEETRGLVSGNGRYSGFATHHRIACQVLYVNSTLSLESGPYYENTYTPLILAQETVDIWFPSHLVSLLKANQTLLFLLDNTSMDGVYYYVPYYHTSADGIAPPFIFYEEGKMVLNNELELFTFLPIKELNERDDRIKQWNPNLNYDEIKIRNGISVQDTIAFFSLWKEYYGDTPPVHSCLVINP